MPGSGGFYVSPVFSPAGRQFLLLPITFLFALRANTLAHPAARKNLAALETPTLLGLVLAPSLRLPVI